MSPEELPEDILLEILTKLPSKSFIRLLSCVCKPWLALLRNPYVITKHLQNVDADKDDPAGIFLKAFLADDDPAAFIVLRSMRDRDGYDPATEIICEEKLYALAGSDNHPSLVASRCLSMEYFYETDAGTKGSACNGLFLDHHYRFRDWIRLYNPTTQKDLTLPPGLFSDAYFHTENEGFGFDKSCNDYKVIRIRCTYGCSNNMEDVRRSLQLEDEMQDLEAFKDYLLEKKQVEIYRFSTRRWSKLEVDMKFRSFLRDGVFLNGFFYWLGKSSIDDSPSILSFDFHAETFDEIELCDDLKLSHGDLCMEVLDDSLAVCSTRRNVDGELLVDVWIMEKNGKNLWWTKKFYVKSIELGKLNKILNFIVRGTSLLLLCEIELCREYRLVCFPLEDCGAKFAMTTLLAFDDYCIVRGVFFRPSLVSPQVDVDG